MKKMSILASMPFMRAMPCRRIVLGTFFVLGMVVGCKDPDPVAYTVTFNTNGGTAVATAKVKSGERVKRPTPDPTKKDNMFADWYADKGFSQRYDFATPVTKNITLYARWVIPPTAIDITGADTVSVGDSTSLSTMPTPANADARVSWTIEDNDDNSKGTIDPTGLYIAPNTIPTPATVTIRATSTVALGVSNTHELTITNLMAIPDANFRMYLKVIIPNAFTGDWLDTAHADVTGLTELTVDKQSISNLRGIEYFTSLNRLYCAYNQLTALDVSHNTSLTELYCNSNQLTALDASLNTSLTGLDCSSNLLDTLDVSLNTSLTFLNCSDNQLDTLDISLNTSLTELRCFSNRLDTLDISLNTSLTVLSCFSNLLKVLNVSSNTSLTELWCYDNQLTDLDVSVNTSLTFLNCSSNQLDTLDVSHNTSLTFLNCSSNQLTALDITGMRSTTDLSIDAGDNGKNPITTLKVHDNLKDNDELKEAKTSRGDTIKIKTYTADAGSTAYTEECPDYNPNTDVCTTP